MTSKLPRELRDMIYAFYWEKELAQYNHTTNERPWRATDVPASHLLSTSTDPRPHHHLHAAQALGPYPANEFVKSACVGEIAAREVAEAFYLMAPAYIETLDAECLDRYFSTDVFGLGITPRKLIKSVIFFLDACVYQPSSSHYKQQSLRLSDSALETLLGSAPQDLPLVTLFVKDEAPIQAGETLCLVSGLYEQLRAVGFDIEVAYNTVPLFSDVKSETIVDLGDVMDRPLIQQRDCLEGACTRQIPAWYGWEHNLGWK
jgi:hypothetical protein